MAARTTLACVFSLLLWTNCIFARGVYVEPISCRNPAPGIGLSGVQDAVQEAINIAANAAKLMVEAVVKEWSTQSQRVSMITQNIYACKPDSDSCRKARSSLSDIGSLKQTNSPRDDTIWVYCNENVLWQQIAAHKGPTDTHKLYWDNICTYAGAPSAIFQWYSIILLCPPAWNQHTVKDLQRTVIGDWKYQDWENNVRGNGNRGWHIDEFDTISMDLLHELAHATSVSRRRTIDNGKRIVEVRDVSLEIKVQGRQMLRVSPYDFRDCRLLATWDHKSSEEYPISDPYTNWYHLMDDRPKGPAIITESRHIAGMSVFNADSLRLGALLMYMINNVFVLDGYAQAYAPIVSA